MTPAAMEVAEAAPGTTAKDATHRLNTKKCSGSEAAAAGVEQEEDESQRC